MARVPSGCTLEPAPRAAQLDADVALVTGLRPQLLLDLGRECPPPGHLRRSPGHTRPRERTGVSAEEEPHVEQENESSTSAGPEGPALAPAAVTADSSTQDAAARAIRSADEEPPRRLASAGGVSEGRFAVVHRIDDYEFLADIPRRFVQTTSYFEDDPFLIDSAKRVYRALRAFGWEDGTDDERAWGGEMTGVFPSVAVLAVRTQMSERNVRRRLRELEQRGLIVAEGISRLGTTLYRLPDQVEVYAATGDLDLLMQMMGLNASNAEAIRQLIEERRVVHEASARASEVAALDDCGSETEVVKSAALSELILDTAAVDGDPAPAMTSVEPGSRRRRAAELKAELLRLEREEEAAALTEWLVDEGLVDLTRPLGDYEETSIMRNQAARRRRSQRQSV